METGRENQPDAPAGDIARYAANVEWDRDPRHCHWCNGPLGRRQSKFCSKAHSTSWYERYRPRKEPRNFDVLTPRMFELYRDGVYRTDREGAALLGALDGTLAMRRRESGYPLTHKRGRAWVWHSRRRVGSLELEHALIVEQA